MYPPLPLVHCWCLKRTPWSFSRGCEVLLPVHCQTHPSGLLYSIINEIIPLRISKSVSITKSYSFFPWLSRDLVMCMNRLIWSRETTYEQYLNDSCGISTVFKIILKAFSNLKSKSNRRLRSQAHWKTACRCRCSGLICRQMFCQLCRRLYEWLYNSISF